MQGNSGAAGTATRRGFVMPGRFEDIVDAITARAVALAADGR